MRNRPPRPSSPVAIVIVLLTALFSVLPGTAIQAAGITTTAEEPLFTDDFDRHSLLEAARRQAEYLRRIPEDDHFKLGTRTVSAELLRRSIATFIEIIEQESSPLVISRRVQESFDFLRAGAGENATFAGSMLVTGYFQPVLDGSLLPIPQFNHPLYRLPPDLIEHNNGTTTSIGRFCNGRLVPYWSREEIETRRPLAGNELLYLADPIEAFILHIQGSGKIRLRDGSCRPVRFAGSNGRPYRSIGRLLVDEGRLTLEQATLPGIVEYLHAHPGESQRILHANPRFIFFAWGKTGTVLGSGNIALTAGRSVAVDPSEIPLGTVAFLKSRQPVVDRNGHLQRWRALDRFVFPQDSGAAIRGGNRLDLFLGDGDEARHAAGLMREKGSLYILVEKSTNGLKKDE
ncbi:MltA domain-containing protein [Desulfoprunum benzoelyticum]|uniref:peptidoglycan lytic exotransglycosylase n=1 Tax=Desulfoprunum benzoelyticum TaxID=1506996 RepID=A0A840V885_9BACT|nr:MltA domain-containing protein [Desulfoprunum benzoelyticum]MBB5349191.1 membrane-bound lytic murein transglycosylase A [Desulfoprunum benzoelyticum]MBM9530573.1 MltA domain-containing protein [Desulfoprunum benzoelyticum]